MAQTYYGNKIWTKHEEAQLSEEFHRGMSVEDIAKVHDRTVGAIRSRIAHLGLDNGMQSTDVSGSSWDRYKIDPMSAEEIQRYKNIVRQRSEEAMANMSPGDRTSHKYLTRQFAQSSNASWSSKDERELLRLGANGFKIFEIAFILGRKESAVKSKFKALGVSEDMLTKQHYWD